jgi:tetratricopeptide (TPR) repeat protein
MSESNPRKRRKVRRHRVPLPITDSAELFDGGEILREFDGNASVVLWKAYKNVRLWAGAQAEERSGLFAPGAGTIRREEVERGGFEQEVAGALSDLADVLDAPESAAPPSVSRACRRLSDWALGRGASATAMLFMQAAALAHPDDPDAACAVGRMARNRAEYARAETWFRQSIFASRAARDWSVYAQAYVGLGKVFWHRGALPAARRCMLRAYRTANRHHLVELRGWALSDLGGLAIHAGRWEEARSYIRSALDLFGPRHPLSLRLLHDLSYAWVTMGWFAPATRVLQAVEPHFVGGIERVLLAGSLARAAGGAGEEHSFLTAVNRIEQLSSEPNVAAVVADAWLDAAHGGASLRCWDVAEMAATAALRLAHERGEARVRLDAEATLESIRAGRGVELNRGAAIPTPPADVSELAAELAGSLGVDADPSFAPAGAAP